jgi:NAD(P)-dependent dehydrogenase (short-subunit alcohol dehydrogenase family)
LLTTLPQSKTQIAWWTKFARQAERQLPSRQRRDKKEKLNGSSLKRRKRSAKSTFWSINAMKAAVDAITRTLGKEFGSRKIRVNSINPGEGPQNRSAKNSCSRTNETPGMQ